MFRFHRAAIIVEKNISLWVTMIHFSSYLSIKSVDSWFDTRILYSKISAKFEFRAYRTIFFRTLNPNPTQVQTAYTGHTRLAGEV